MLREMFVAALAFAQSALGPGASMGSVPVSPSVIATVMSSIDVDGKGALDLLVLWRGSPGWFTRDGVSASGGGGSAGPAGANASRLGVRTAWLSEGGVSLSVRFEPASRKVWIQDQEMDLNESNVVLVDDVDQSGGPLVVRALRIDPSYQVPMRLPVPPQTLIGRSPELIEYLRCDVGSPDAPEAEMRAYQELCAAAYEQSRKGKG